MTQTKIAIICGVDGSGKSTLRHGLEDHGYVVSYYKKLKGTKWGKELNFVNPGQVAVALKGEERLNYLLGYLNAETSWLHEIQKKHNNIISDGYYLRFLIKEKVFGVIPFEDIIKYGEIVPFEKHYIMLDINPETCYERKIKTLSITPYECFTNNRIGFISFQNMHRKYLIEYLSMQSNKIIVDASISIERVLIKALKYLKENGF